MRTIRQLIALSFVLSVTFSFPLIAASITIDKLTPNPDGTPLVLKGEGTITLEDGETADALEFKTMRVGGKAATIGKAKITGNKWTGTIDCGTGTFNPTTITMEWSKNNVKQTFKAAEDKNDQKVK